jgi:hypothetical protein
MTTQEMVQDAITRGDVAPDDLQLLIEMSELAAPEPDAPDHITEGDEDIPRAARLPTQGAGYVSLRRAQDGKIKVFPRTLLASKLRQRRPDRTKAWLDPRLPWTPPATENFLPCLLHPTHSDSFKYRQMGLDPCSKANFKNNQAVLVHVSGKHKVAWGAIKEAGERERVDRRDDLLLAALNKLTGVVAEPSFQPPPTVSGNGTANSCGCGGILSKAPAGIANHNKAKRHQKWLNKRGG